MERDTFTTPIDQRYFEDYIPGVVHEFGPITVEEAEIISFANRFDPQPFHTDPEAAKKSVYGGLIASGWHTASLDATFCGSLSFPCIQPGIARTGSAPLDRASTAWRHAIGSSNSYRGKAVAFKTRSRYPSLLLRDP